jgi:hypothetical protein
LKGVSDFGDEYKGVDPNDTEPGAGAPTVKVRALHKTAEALKAWIVHRIPSITWEPDYGM